MAHDEAYYEAEKKIEQAWHSGARELNLAKKGVTELPETIGQLTPLLKVDLAGDDYQPMVGTNWLTELPESLGQLSNLILRELHAFLKRKDPGFGGLRRVQNKRQGFLWVHERFASEY